jgi:hypothetical protein
VGVCDVSPKDLERWVVLCELAIKERDPKKFLEIVKQLNELLDARRGFVSGGSVPRADKSES